MRFSSPSSYPPALSFQNCRCQLKRLCGLFWWKDIQGTSPFNSLFLNSLIKCFFTVCLGSEFFIDRKRKKQLLKFQKVPKIIYHVPVAVVKTYFYVRLQNHSSSSAIKQTTKNTNKTKYNIYIHANLPVNAIVRLPHSQSGDSQGQETFLAPSADKQTRNHDTECSNHHPSLSTPRPKGLSHSKMKWWAIYTKLPVNVIVILLHYSSGDSRGRETFLAPSADKQTRIYINRIKQSKQSNKEN